MQKITLHALPDDEPWGVDDFVERTEESCRSAAVDLHRKSLMVEEAVEEVLELVRNAATSFKSTAETDQFDFLNREGETRSYIQTIETNAPIKLRPGWSRRFRRRWPTTAARLVSGLDLLRQSTSAVGHSGRWLVQRNAGDGA